MQRVRTASAPVDDAVLRKDSREIHLCDRLDNSRSADPRYAGRRRRLGETRLVGPQVTADHLEARLERRAVDADALDRAGRRSLPAGNLGALEGRAGRGRAREQALAVTEHDLGVGAHIDDEPHLVAEIGRLGQHHAGGVGADVAGDARQRIDERPGRDVEAEIPRPRLMGAVDRQREGRSADLGRIEAEDEMMHDRIADQCRLDNLISRDAALRGRFADEIVDRLADAVRELRVAARIHHHVRDPAHQVFAESDLRVHPADRGDDRSGHKVAEISGYGGRADVDGDAEGALGEAGEDRDDVAPLAQGDGRLPSASAQELLQGRERGEVGGGVDDAPLLHERLLQAAEVARRLAHVRLANLDIVQPDDRIDLDRMLFGALAHHLPVNLAFRRHVDDQVAQGSSPGSRGAAPAQAVRACRRSVARPRSSASHGRRGTRLRAWRTGPRPPRSGSAHRCRGRRRPSRDRRRARAPQRAGSFLLRSRRVCQTA